jgi:hypothetical protein
LDLGKRIKTLRTSRGISARHLAQSSGIDPSLISKIENGISNPSIDTLQKICDTLDVSMSDFFCTQKVDPSEDLLALMTAARRLTPEQIKILTSLISSFKGK